MRNNKLLTVGSHLVTLVLVSLSYWLIGAWWVGLLLAAVYLSFHLLQKRATAAWLNAVMLLLCVGFCGYGFFRGGSRLMLMAGAIFALAAWEIGEDAPTDEGRSLSGNAILFERKRLAVLGIALGMGLAVGAVGLTVSVPLPFFALVLSVLIVLYCLYRFFRLFRVRG